MQTRLQQWTLILWYASTVKEVKECVWSFSEILRQNGMLGLIGAILFSFFYFLFFLFWEIEPDLSLIVLKLFKFSWVLDFHKARWVI